MHAATTAHAFPLFAAAMRRQLLVPVRRWVVAWSVLYLATNIFALILALQSVNNHWLNYIATPVAAGLALWTLSLWQTSQVAALSLRLLVPLLGITWVGMVVLVEDTLTFSLLAEPFAGLLVLSAAIYTLVSKVFQERGDLLRQDWLWVGLGLAVYSAAAIALPPAANWLIARHPELVVKAYEAKALFEIVALLAIARGVTCPIPESRSGGFLSRASSPSPSSSSASSSPS
jgi:hypothetical protein